MADVNPNDVILTGLPRSGSTLACELLNRVEQTVALDEPIDPGPWIGRPAYTKDSILTRYGRKRRRKTQQHSEPVDPDMFCNLVDRFFVEIRASILNEGRAISKAVGGTVKGKKFDERPDRSGTRQMIGAIQEVEVTKTLVGDFTLVVKHNARFAALISHLTSRFRCYAVVRNPIAMLASWQTVELPIKHGRAGEIERVDHELRERIASMDDVYERQLAIMAWLFETFGSALPDSSVIRYEDLIASGGRVLGVISPGAAALDETLLGQNTSRLYDRELMAMFARRLLSSDGAWRRFYTDEDVRELSGV